MKAHTGMEIIPRQECLRLLASQKVGRLGFVDDDQPMILPVNYALAGDIVVFRTGEGPKLDSARLGKVAFEVDQVDADAQAGWSVLVQGVAREFTDDDDWFAAQLRHTARPTWLPVNPRHFVRIIPRLISGRRVPLASGVSGPG
jgi:nitroimidazol reductase NimA-like FMN-containing flavoprotein (pyridoxamine 5'-phosphate oxidase superfamily)